MKKQILFLIMGVLALNLTAQNNEKSYWLHIIKDGETLDKYSITHDFDSIVFYNPYEGVFTDSRDGNSYNSIRIGNQWWMVENMRYLPEVNTPNDGSESAARYYVYGYNGSNQSEAKAHSNYTTYGVLYNHTAATTACPDGWHLPSDAEWDALISHLGGQTIAGGKMKESGTAHWKTPNSAATNESGFTALPGGMRSGSSFSGLTENANFWSATTGSSTTAWYRDLFYTDGEIVKSGPIDKVTGFSVRCIKD